MNWTGTLTIGDKSGGTTENLACFSIKNIIVELFNTNTETVTDRPHKVAHSRISAHGNLLH